MRPSQPPHITGRDDILKLAQDCFTQARRATNWLTKAQLRVSGNEHMRQAEELRRDESVVQAVFPKSDSSAA
jgi:hypothetical protein